MNSFTKMIRISTVLCIVLTLRLNAGTDDIDQMIRQNRMGELAVKAKPGAAVRVEQVKHEFWFGAAISSSIFSGRDDSADKRKYKEVFLNNFNAAVTKCSEMARHGTTKRASGLLHCRCYPQVDRGE